MTGPSFQGAFPHQHGDPRGLMERIETQLRERIAEAVEMAGLGLMVELRRRHGRPPPESENAADRREFEETVHELLAHLREAFHGDLTPERRAELERTEAGADESERLLSGQALLARQLPDYWQRFETHRAAYAKARLEAPASRRGWLGWLRGG
jgi:hypothetical protein